MKVIVSINTDHSDNVAALESVRIHLERAGYVVKELTSVTPPREIYVVPDAIIIACEPEVDIHDEPPV